MNDDNKNCHTIGSVLSISIKAPLIVNPMTTPRISLSIRLVFPFNGHSYNILANAKNNTKLKNSPNRTKKIQPNAAILRRINKKFTPSTPKNKISFRIVVKFFICFNVVQRYILFSITPNILSIILLFLAKNIIILPSK